MANEKIKEYMYRQIGGRVAYYRKLKRLTQQDLADQAHTSRSTIARIEQGKYNNNISLSTLIDISQVLEVDVSTLVRLDEEEIRLMK